MKRKPATNDQDNQRYLRSTLLAASALHFALLLLLWKELNTIPEAIWPAALLFAAPQHWLFLPTLGLAAVTLFTRRYKLLVLQLPATALIAFKFVGFNLPLLPALADSPSAPNTTRLNVMSYNVRFATHDSGQIEAIARKQNPDILCVQEASPAKIATHPLTLLQRALPDHQMVTRSELAIFSRFPITAWKFHRPTQFPAIGVLEARLQVEGKELTVFCVHWTNLYTPAIFRSLTNRRTFKIQHRSARSRAAYRKAQSELVTQLIRETRTPYLIIGDFNTAPRGVLYNALSQYSQDAWKQTGWGQGATYPARLPLERIDYIWTGNGTQARASRVLDSRGSDHRPLVAEVTLP